jgi:hypothetical protein
MSCIVKCVAEDSTLIEKIFLAAWTGAADRVVGSARPPPPASGVEPKSKTTFGLTARIRGNGLASEGDHTHHAQPPFRLNVAAPGLLARLKGILMRVVTSLRDAWLLKPFNCTGRNAPANLMKRQSERLL